MLLLSQVSELAYGEIGPKRKIVVDIAHHHWHRSLPSTSFIITSIGHCRCHQSFVDVASFVHRSCRYRSSSLAPSSIADTNRLSLWLASFVVAVDTAHRWHRSLMLALFIVADILCCCEHRALPSTPHIAVDIVRCCRYHPSSSEYCVVADIAHCH